MWVDLFVDPAKNGAPPPPVDISCRKPNEYAVCTDEIFYNDKGLSFEATF